MARHRDSGGLLKVIVAKRRNTFLALAFFLIGCFGLTSSDRKETMQAESRSERARVHPLPARFLHGMLLDERGDFVSGVGAGRCGRNPEAAEGSEMRIGQFFAGNAIHHAGAVVA